MPHDVEHLYLTDPIARFRRDRRHHVLRRRRRIYLRARGARFRRHGPAARPRDPASASTRARSAGRCCRRANASAPPRSAHRNTASSSPAIPATSRRPGRCCRGAICRCCSRPIEFGDDDRRRQARARRSAATSRPSRSRTASARSRSRLRWTGMPAYERLAAFAEGISRGLADRIAREASRCSSCSTATSRRRSAQSCARNCKVESEILVIDGVDADGFRLHRSRHGSACRPTPCR